METPLKKSKQREAILQCVKAHHDHPTADVVYQEVREDFPNISLGTVYRNLSLLTRIGQIRKIMCDDHADHFDGTVQSHSHFICNECGCLLDIPFELEPALDQEANVGFKGKITEHTLLFHGFCEKCAGRS